jgi:hypothetical protein
MTDVDEDHLFDSRFFGKGGNHGDLPDIVFDHEKDDVHSGSR